MTDEDKETAVEQLEAQAVAMDADVEELGIVKKSEYAETQAEIEELREENEDLEGEMEELREEVSLVKETYAEELSEVTGFDAETLTEKFELEELRAKFEDEFESAEALTGNTPEPKGEDPEKDAPSSEEQERIEELREKKEVYEEMNWDSNVTAVEEELADLQGK